jgi:hypothetical protein
MARWLKKHGGGAEIGTTREEKKRQSSSGAEVGLDLGAIKVHASCE